MPPDPTMKLTPDMADTYLRYKQGTKSFTQWLAQTARATGKVDELFKSTPSVAASSTGGRLKGKARVEAKKLAATTPTTFNIPLKHFGRLATAIAGSKVAVPANVFTLLRAVIRGRKECTQWYLLNRKTSDATVDDDDDSRHQHFINILTNVYNILEPKKAKIQTASSSKTTATQSSLDTINNQFQRLSVEDTMDTDELPEVMDIPATETKIQYNADTSETDVSFAVYCLLRDMNHLRRYVRLTWEQFQRSEIELQTAALVTKAACLMAERLDTEFQDDFLNFKGDGNMSMWNKILRLVAQNTGTDTHDDPFMTPHGTLNSILGIHMVHLAYRSLVCADFEDLFMSWEDYTFVKCLAQLAASPAPGVHPFFDDDVAHRAVHEMAKGKAIDLWMVFSLQVLWDTGRVAHTARPAPREILEQKVIEIRDRHVNLFAVPGLETLGKHYKKHHKNTQGHDAEHQKWITYGGIQQLLNSLEALHPNQIYFPAFRLLDYHATLAGLPLAHLLDTNHACSVLMASESGLVLTVAHLYNAAQCMGYLPEETKWDDLEWFIEQQGVQWIYVGAPPKIEAEFGRRLDIVLGTKVSKHSKDIRLASSQNLKEWYGSIRMFRNFEYCARYSELKVDRSTKDKTVVGQSRAEKDLLIMANWLAKDGMDPKEKSKSLSLVNTLELFKHALEKDHAVYNFDVLALYTQCFEILFKIKQHCILNAPHDYPADRCDMGLGLVGVVHKMLNCLDGRPLHHQSMLPEAMEILKKGIEAKGRSVVTEMRDKNKKKPHKCPDTKVDGEAFFVYYQEDIYPLPVRNDPKFETWRNKNGFFEVPFEHVRFPNEGKLNHPRAEGRQEEGDEIGHAEAHH